MNCPKCNAKIIDPFFALSRDDNMTKVCPDCGVKEGILQFLEAQLMLKAQTDWTEQDPV